MHGERGSTSAAVTERGAVSSLVVRDGNATTERGADMTSEEREARMEVASGVLAAMTAVGVLLVALAPLAIPILALTGLFLAPLLIPPLLALPIVAVGLLIRSVRRRSRPQPPTPQRERQASSARLRRRALAQP